MLCTICFKAYAGDRSFEDRLYKTPKIAFPIIQKYMKLLFQ